MRKICKYISNMNEKELYEFFLTVVVRMHIEPEGPVATCSEI